MKILFVMEKRVDAGSIQAVTNYMRAGDGLGHTFALYGRHEPNFPQVRFSTELNNFDYVLFIVESRLQWMNCLRLAPILSRVPRWRRAILDADGMYNQWIAVEDYDHNHSSERERWTWLTTFDYLADKILQPTLKPREPKVIPLLFYGYDPTAQMKPAKAPLKRYDILHLGHNWWRWREVRDSLLPAIEQIRSQLDGICFIGAWWDAVPPWARALNLEAAFGVDNDRFQQLGIQVKSPVPYTEVIRAMSEGRVNLMTQRPLFRHLKILTSKYFEIFCADTIPLVMLEPDHAEVVYGPRGRQLALHDAISDRLLDTLSHPDKYREIVEQVRRHLTEHHSYQTRVQELIAALAA